MTNNLETIDFNDFQKLEDTIAPTVYGNVTYSTANYYNINLSNTVSCSSNTTVNNVFSFYN